MLTNRNLCTHPNLHSVNFRFLFPACSLTYSVMINMKHDLILKRSTESIDDVVALTASTFASSSSSSLIGSRGTRQGREGVLEIKI